MRPKVILATAIALTVFVRLSLSLTFPIVGTGQTKYYDNKGEINKPQPGEPFYGQDGHYVKNVPAYTNNNNGTVTDNITGLMWQANMGAKITFDQAKVKADTLSLGGHSDWRVPTIKELYSLILFTGRASGESVIDKFIDTTVFDQPLGSPRPIDAQTVSSTEYVGTTMNGNATVFGVNFLDGRIKGYPKSNVWYFRMVRGVSTYGINDFVDNNDGTITDRATGLMWQKVDDGTSRDWKEALAYAEALQLAGYTDWRLPSSKELQGIVDYTRAPDITKSPAINPLFTCTEIKDPDGNPGQYPYYWSGTTHLDGPNPGGTAAYVAFGEAQGKMNNVLMDVHGAGAQRSDPKSGNVADYPQFIGPQGDVRYVYNYVRCVRNASPMGINDKTPKPGHKSTLLLNYNYNYKTNTISFSNMCAQQVVLRVYNCKGIAVATLEDRFLPAGSYSYHVPKHCISMQIFIAVLKNGPEDTRQMFFPAGK